MEQRTLLLPSWAALVLLALVVRAPVEAQTAGSAVSDCVNLGVYGHTVRDGDRVLGTDEKDWILLDVETGRPIAQGPMPNIRWTRSFHGALAGSLVLLPLDAVDQAGEPLALLDARDGRRIGTVPPGGYLQDAGIAPDGSYAWVVNNKTTIWSPRGERLTEAPALGDRVFATPDELRLLSSTRYSALRIRDGQITHHEIKPERGGWGLKWFRDGEHFVHDYEDFKYARIYGADGAVKQQMGPFTPGFIIDGAYGTQLWGRDFALTGQGLYRLAPLGADGRPVRTLALSPTGRHPPLVEASGATLFAPDLDDPRALEVVRIDGDTHHTARTRLPGWIARDSFSADAHGRWSLAAGGVIYTGEAATPEAFKTIGCRTP